MTAARLLQVANRIYSLALIIMPGRRAVRRRFAADMRATFASRAAAAALHGRVAIVVLLGRELGDLLGCAVQPRSRRPSPAPPGRNRVTAILQDVRYACRMLRRQPAFSGVALLTLALGIGATASVFTVVDGVLLRPLPYADPDRLVILLNGRNGRLVTSFSPPNYRDAWEKSGAFTSAAAISPTTMNLTGSGDPQRLEGADVTWTFFAVLGATPRLGRAFVENDVATSARVVVISDGLWRRLGARADIVGTDLRLDDQPYTVVGVARPALRFPGRPDYWRPLIFTPHQLDESQRGAQWVNVIARLRDGVSLPQANAALAAGAGQLQAAAKNFGNRQFAAALLHDRMVNTVRPALLVLFAAVGMVLLIACVNVANLLLARAYGRSR